MKVIGKDRTSCDVCNPIDEIIARLDALERRASAIVAKVQGIAPDGEGNVTLPTSSSDTDPLHGRVDAFAMSSEVKEAADDAHAYAASIADDVVVINSEIVALNQAVEALQPAEIEAIKSAVQALQTTVTTLESTVATLGSNVSEKVSKSGDTMAGTLTLPRVDTKSNEMVFGTIPSANQFLDNSSLDKDGNAMVLDRLFRGNNGDIIKQLGIRDRSGNFHWVNLLAVSDGGDYASTPSWSPGTNDNSDKILTIKMANSLPSLVHTTGNETIAGLKTFTSRIVEQKSSDMGIEMLSTSFDRSATYTSYQRPVQFIARDKNGDSVMLLQTYAESNNRRGLDLMMYDMGGKHCELSLKSDGSIRYATAPTTPSGATGTEIATANWVITKINELATKNNLAGL